MVPKEETEHARKEPRDRLHPDWSRLHPGRRIGSRKTHLRGAEAPGEYRAEPHHPRLRDRAGALEPPGQEPPLVGLGSYIINAQGGCNDCHTDPSYAPGGDPFLGQPEQINVARYLAGGRNFGIAISANITPDANGRPAGLTFPEFRTLIRTGHEPDEPDEILQVMPWPVYRKMTDRDLRAIYEYLSAIPHID